MRVSIDDMKTLFLCVDRCITSQTRMTKSLEFFKRQFEDEKQVMQEARNQFNAVLAGATTILFNEP